jgi:hypothetical protein
VSAHEALAGVDWQDVTLLLLEQTRVRVRDLAKLLARRRHKNVCIDFEDWLGDTVEVRRSALSSLAVQLILI